MSETDERSEAMKALNSIRSYVKEQIDHYRICSGHEAESVHEAEIYDACKDVVEDILVYISLAISEMGEDE